MTTTCILWALFRTTLVLTICGGVCFLALRNIEHRLPKLSRLLWAAVLLTGWFWLQPVIEIPTAYLAGTPAEEMMIKDSNRYAPLVAQGALSSAPLCPSPIREEGREIGETSVLLRAQNTVIPAIPAQERGGASPSVTTYLLALWLIGMLVVILFAAVGYLRILLSLRKAEPAEDALAEPWRKLLSEQGIDPKAVPMVLTHSNNNVGLGPALVRTPLGYRLAIPSELWSELSESGRQGILKHELAHFRRRDVWKSFFVRILALPHWFNPVAYYAANRFDELAEQQCDREAFAGKQKTISREKISEFARILLLLHENAPTRFVGQYRVARQSIFGRKLGNNLRRRIAILLENPLTERTFTMRKTLLVLGTAAILFAALFRVEFVASQTAANAVNEPRTLESDGTVADSQQATPHETLALNPRLAQIRGKAFLPDGSPANGMQLVITGQSRINAGHGSKSSSHVEPNGNFTINAFPNSDCMISIFDPNGRWAAPSQFLTVKDEEEYAREIIFRLVEGTRITGRIIDETTGNPIPNMDISVSFYSSDRVPEASTFFRIKSDERGNYGFTALAADDVFVNIGSMLIHRNAVRIPGQERQARLLRRVVFDSQPVINLDFQIPPPFVGRVLLANGSPAVDASVQIVPYRFPHDNPSGASFVQTDRDGLFRVMERPQHVFCLIWSRNNEIFIGWFDDDMPRTGEKVFQLQRASGIRGRLTDAATQQPLADQLILIERSNVANPNQRDFMPFRTRTDNEGFFDHRVHISAGVCHKLFIVPGLQQYFGGPTEPRVVLATVIPETPGTVVNLGVLEVAIPREQATVPPTID